MIDQSPEWVAQRDRRTMSVVNVIYNTVAALGYVRDLRRGYRTTWKHKGGFRFAKRRVSLTPKYRVFMYVLVTISLASIWANLAVLLGDGHDSV